MASAVDGRQVRVEIVHEDGYAAVRRLDQVCEQIEHHGSFGDAAILFALITSENAAFVVMQEFLKAVGFARPQPNCLGA